MTSFEFILFMCLFYKASTVVCFHIGHDIKSFLSHSFIKQKKMKQPHKSKNINKQAKDQWYKEINYKT